MLVKDVFGLGMYIFRRNSPSKSVHFWYVQIGEEVEKIIRPYKRSRSKSVHVLEKYGLKKSSRERCNREMYKKDNMDKSII